MAVERTTVRRARKERRCSSAYVSCSRWIRFGDLYLEHVVGPGHDILDNTTWLRIPECSVCAEERGSPIQAAAP